MEKLILFRNDPNALILAKLANLLGVRHEIVDEIPKHPFCAIIPGKYFEMIQGGIPEDKNSIMVYEAGASKTICEKFKPVVHSSLKIEVSRVRPDITKTLSGLTFEKIGTETVFSSREDFNPLIFADDIPLFLVKNRFFLLGSSEVLDIDTIGREDYDPYRQYFTEVFPFVMFIKWAFKERSWHSPVHCACIIIDDPLLRRKYGFIDIPQFIKWLQDNNLAATFAFIPWNHNRSEAHIAKMFCNNSDRLSICIHGCDHTGGEFGISDSSRLDALSGMAMARMEKHKNKYALSYDRVMVFPQGKFSEESLRALGRSGYVAAVNTDVFPIDYNGNFTIRDLFNLAINLPFSVPLYRRRYPVNLFDFACDIFFEKPVFIVQHHQDFRNGFDHLLSFIQSLQKIMPDLRWMPLGAALAQSFWQRAENNGTVEVRKLDWQLKQNGLVEKMKYSLKERAGIAFRRYLSEFRDNHVNRSKILTAALKLLRNRV